MRKRTLFLILALSLLFLIACGKGEPETVYGECLLSGEYEELTETEFTSYLQEGYGLSELIDHKVYHCDGNFQVDFQFSKDAPDWQLDSAANFANEKFFQRKNAKISVWQYDLWLTENSSEKTNSVNYRIFVGDELKFNETVSQE